MDQPAATAPQPRSDQPTGPDRSGRSRRWLLPVVVVVLWLLVGGPLGSFAGQLSAVQENDNAGFLPRSAESTEVLDLVVGAVGQETIPVTLVVERETGLRGTDRAAVADLRPRLAAVEGVAEDGVGRLQVSADGEAGQLVVELSAQDGEEVVTAVEDLRAVLEDVPPGLTALAGGQGGVLADFVDAFSAIDGILLLVALVVVFVILVVVYRSPVLPLVVLVSAVLGLGVASAVVYALATNDVIDLNGQSQGILFILAIGAATDYSLLIVARFREALRDTASSADAMRLALRGAWEPVVASGLTVILGLLCLLLSDLSSLAGLGPVGALGIAGAMLSSLTLLPAALVLLGRRAFWPLMPAQGSPHGDERGLWAGVARVVTTRATAVAVVTTIVLGTAAAFVVTLDEDPVPQTELFLTAEESVDAQDVLVAHFDADSASPVQVVVPQDETDRVVSALTGAPGLAGTNPFGPPPVLALPSPQDPAEPLVTDGRTIVLATLADPADSLAATRTVERLRSDLARIDPAILVGGATAIQIDTLDTTARDRSIVIPTILVVIFVVLALLLRSLVSAAIIIAANVLSFAATLGVAALVFDHVLGFPSSDPSTVLIGFVFLVALGIDYSIFLMTRVREETMLRGTRPAIVKGLAVTGGVITSAGVVLAATFAALGVVPILFLAEIAFIVAFGVLLDTLVVRSLLVPAVCHLLGPRIWWPSRLARAEGPGATPVGGAHRA